MYATQMSYIWQECQIIKKKKLSVLSLVNNILSMISKLYTSHIKKLLLSANVRFHNIGYCESNAYTVNWGE